MDFTKISDQLLTLVTLYGTKLLLVVVTLIVGLWIIGQLVKFLSKLMNNRHVDRDVQPFLLSLFSGLLRVLLLLSVASTLGLETTSFVAIIGAAGLAVGLALQGSLSNFAGGVLILIFKPFRVGDLISAQGFTGHVDAIQIFNTILVTPDNKTIILPNGPLSTAPITNVSTRNLIRVDMTFAVGNDNDLNATRASVQKVIDACPYALKDQTHDILVNHLNDNGVAYDVRVWTKPETYWEAYYYVQENVASQFRTDGISGQKNAVLIRQA
ncbi:mechanosensitive ion channel family protein [Fibrella forsythiae]|uniref:Mechanosensitive ion channel n=1 Tax=Fibrella forsythiae TaxID=2817061 RepID=A0ABS3JJS1_9BACT|nr:mechanosensitive ion channel domain-containing protein [Fibrella forsythiae]MBO0950238.1 mechanosensitive ion channel [Fibrella forsythiae]